MQNTVRAPPLDPLSQDACEPVTPRADVLGPEENRYFTQAHRQWRLRTSTRPGVRFHDSSHSWFPPRPKREQLEQLLRGTKSARRLLPRLEIIKGTPPSPL